MGGTYAYVRGQGKSRSFMPVTTAMSDTKCVSAGPGWSSRKRVKYQLPQRLTIGNERLASEGIFKFSS